MSGFLMTFALNFTYLKQKKILIVHLSCRFSLSSMSFSYICPNYHQLLHIITHLQDRCSATHFMIT